jgi:hypothetical protein
MPKVAVARTQQDVAEVVGSDPHRDGQGHRRRFPDGGFETGNSRNLNQFRCGICSRRVGKSYQKEQRNAHESDTVLHHTGYDGYDNDGTPIAITTSMSDLASSVSAVPATAVLDNWASAEWTDGCQVDGLPLFQALTVFTHNSLYELIVVDPVRGVVRVRGGQFFPDWREAQLAGCSLGGSFLKMRGIYAGFCMEVHVGGEIIITSPVVRLTLSHLEERTAH